MLAFHEAFRISLYIGEEQATGAAVVSKKDLFGFFSFLINSRKMCPTPRKPAPDSHSTDWVTEWDLFCHNSLVAGAW